MIEEYDFYGFDPFDFPAPPEECRKINAGKELDDHSGLSEETRRQLKEFSEELARGSTISGSSEKK